MLEVDSLHSQLGTIVEFRQHKWKPPRHRHRPAPTTLGFGPVGNTTLNRTLMAITSVFSLFGALVIMHGHLHHLEGYQNHLQKNPGLYLHR